MDWLVCDQGFFLFGLSAVVATDCLSQKLASQTRKNKNGIFCREDVVCSSLVLPLPLIVNKQKEILRLTFFPLGLMSFFHSDVLTSSIFVLDKKLTPSLVLFPQLSSEAEHDHQKNIPLLNMMTHHVYMIIFNT